MRRAIFVIFTVLLIGVVIFFHRCCTTSEEVIVVEKEDIRYRLNDSIYNRHSDLPEMKNMEKYITRWMARNNIRAASLAVMKDEHLIYSKGFGWADKEQEREAEVGDIYRIASASKLVPAVGIMKLCEEGLLTLDSKVFGAE